MKSSRDKMKCVPHLKERDGQTDAPEIPLSPNSPPTFRPGNWECPNRKNSLFATFYWLKGKGTKKKGRYDRAFLINFPSLFRLRQTNIRTFENYLSIRAFIVPLGVRGENMSNLVVKFENSKLSERAGSQ